MKKSIQVVAEVSFDEYKAARLSGEWPESMTKEQLLMALFEAKGIVMVAGAKPKQPVEIVNDENGKKFIIKQIQ